MRWGGVEARPRPGTYVGGLAVVEAESDELKDSDKESAGFIY